jgi:hypothetical protein
LLDVARPSGEAPNVDASMLAADVNMLKVAYFLKTFLFDFVPCPTTHLKEYAQSDQRVWWEEDEANLFAIAVEDADHSPTKK